MVKIRHGYVSNSSSSSHIVTKDLTDQGIVCLKLTEAQKTLINGSVIDNETVYLDLSKDFWLTQFIYDGDDKLVDIIKETEHVFYSNGQMCGEPYNEDMFNEYQIDGDTSVWLRKEHDEAKQMKFTKFVKQIKDSYGKNVEVIVKYNSNDDINLKIIKKDEM